MKKLGMILVLAGAISNAYAIATAPGVNNTHQNFLGGVARGEITSTLFNPQTAGAFLFEAGPRNYRANGTLGYALTDNQRIKLTGEYLTQDIDYNFFSGRSRQWVNQSAVALAYQLGLAAIPGYFDISGFYSHAPSKNLNTLMGTYLEPGTTGNIINYTNLRRIAGSNAGGVSPGVTIFPWIGSEATLALNYDTVTYDNVYVPKIKVNGFGGTFGISQRVGQMIAAFTAAVRAPFNAYQAEFDWNTNLLNNGLIVGIFGNYTQGKRTLPDTSLIGLNVKLALNGTSARTPIPSRETFVAWTGKPAVYMPEVLAVADESVTKRIVGGPLCAAFSGTIPSQTVDTGTPLTLDTSSFFTGDDLAFSATGLPPGLSIDSQTGIISGTPEASSGAVTVTAINSCGTAVSNTFSITVI